MRIQLSTLLQTLTGKVIAALVVISTGVGAAAAAGAGVPLVPSPDDGPVLVADESMPAEDGADGVDAGGERDEDGARPKSASEPGDAEPDGDAPGELGDEVNHGAVVSEFTRSTALTGCEKGQATAAVARGDVDPSSTSFEADLTPFLERCSDDDAAGGAGDDEADGDASGEELGDEANHGAAVSEFTRSTELTGCEKGQATAAVARGDVDPSAESFEVDLAPFLDRCSGDDDAEDDGGDDDADEDEDESSDEVNHGAVVSEFTETTELTGCEKGQATAAVARGDVDPSAESFEADLAPFLERCSGDDDAAGDAGDDDVVTTGDEPTEVSAERADKESGRPPHANDRGRSGKTKNERAGENGQGRGNGKP
ncbi:MAG: hypothetical protein CL424_13710 [Acidimicrobiaceae bacterium]|nr:hypothetical protein [Acidimicrobiaceae bacterium]